MRPPPLRPRRSRPCVPRVPGVRSTQSTVHRTATRWALGAALALAVACERDPTGPGPSSLPGHWVGSNAVAALDVRLSNVGSAQCNYGGVGEATPQVKLEGTYQDLRTGETIDVTDCMGRRRDAEVIFVVFRRDDGVTYATTNLVGQVTDATTIRATLYTNYAQTSDGGSSWTTWTADSATLTLHRQ